MNKNIEGLLSGSWAPSEKNQKNVILGFVSLQRVFVALMGPLMFLAGMTLALQSIPSFIQIVVGFIAVYLLTAAEHTIDDYIDIERDKVKWPHRALPTGLISRLHAGLYAIILASIGVVLSYIFFNWQVVIIECIALGLGTAYPYLRDHIGYLSLPPVPALIGIAGWVSISPETLFTSITPWILYLVFVCWQSFHILSMPWAIKHQKSFLVKLTPKNTVRLSVLFSIITFFFTYFLYLQVGFNILYLIVILLLSSFFWHAAYKMIKTPLDDTIVFKAFKAATTYNIFLCLAIMIFSIWP